MCLECPGRSSAQRDGVADWGGRGDTAWEWGQPFSVWQKGSVGRRNFWRGQKRPTSIHMMVWASSGCGSAQRGGNDHVRKQREVRMGMQLRTARVRFKAPDTPCATLEVFMYSGGWADRQLSRHVWNSTEADSRKREKDKTKALGL